MRILLLLTLLFLGCQGRIENRNTDKKSSAENLTVDLIKEGILNFTDPLKLDSIKLAFPQSLDIYSPDVFRFVHIDAEELSEGSFEFFTSGLFKLLEKRGIEILINKAENFDMSNEVIINSRRFKLFEQQNLSDKTYADIAPRRFFKAINEVLSERKLNERFYLLYGWNDLGAILLTEKQFEILKEIYKGKTNEIPYEP